MAIAEIPSASAGRAPEPISISALNHFLYCERRAYLIHAERVFIDNEHTLLGTLAHEAVDHPGYEHRAGWELLRALPLFSDALGLTGKADLVEVRRDPATARIVETRPVEYKKGPARRWSNDHVQLCAQALCLEEMLGLPIEAGLIYHAASAKRDEVVFDLQLRTLTRDTLDALRASLARPAAPPTVLRPQCDGCSLRPVCLPEASTLRQSDLFVPRDY
ncbi:MAG: CRISPR-associated protein Cas4 [Opitutaceae bacterium]|nr:CRISPR-associated protein Cas4 [Opitutaceae bacterium]